MDLLRLRQVIKYASIHSKQLSAQINKNRVFLFIDMIKCFLKYKMWTNQYVSEKFYLLTKNERNDLGKKYFEEGKFRDEWQKDFRENRKFLLKYTSRKYELPHLREKRNKAYSKRYNAGKNLFVEHDVEISRQHYLPGTIKIGDNVLLAKHVTIDYSGNVIIKDNVTFSEYANVLSHEHKSTVENFKMGLSKSLVFQSTVVFEDSCWICANAMILASCHKVGRGAIVGGGAVCRNEVPPYSIVVGNPAEVVKFRYTLDEIFQIEETYPESERIPRKTLESNYKKYYQDCLSEIK